MQYSLYLVSALFFILLFLDGPDSYSARSYGNVWNLGHILCFAVWTYALLISSEKLAVQSLSRQLLIVLSLAVIAAILTESLQAMSGGDVELGDMRRDIVGSLLAIAYFTPKRTAILRDKRLMLQLGVIALVFIELMPFSKSLADEAIARRQFPVLADFETSFEINRWKSLSHLSIDNMVARSGAASLKVPLTTDKYSGVSMRYFPRDWREYKHLNLSIFNPDNRPLRLEVRIHDELHIKNGQEYYDRFNTHFILAKGWNDKIIPLEQIAKAPKTRIMDLGNIIGVGMFAMNLPDAVTIHIDDIKFTR